MKRIVLLFLLALSLGCRPEIALAQGTPMRTPRVIVPEGVAPPTVVVTPTAAERIVELMTYYTLSVAGGVAAGGLVASLFTGNWVGVGLGGVIGAALAVSGYSFYLRGGQSAGASPLF